MCQPSTQKLTRDLGADETINYVQQPRLARAVRTLTDGRGVEVLFEHVGAATWKDSAPGVRQDCPATFETQDAYIIIEGRYPQAAC
jgi:NADPH:quinone reductase-like Zn-dependent oxidoreductase